MSIGNKKQGPGGRRDIIGKKKQGTNPPPKPSTTKKPGK
jgi:hypothetical protein